MENGLFRQFPNEIIDVQSQTSHSPPRITSYNVCYTKLLRLSERGEDERQALRKLIREEMKKVLDEMGLVTKEDIQKLIEKQNQAE